MANTSGKQGTSASHSASGNVPPNPSATVQPKSQGAENSENWALKSIGLIAYAVATAVGYYYASAYYDSFGIDILDHAAPLDLLLVALENIDKVLFAAFVVPLVFLLLLAVSLIVLVLLPFTAVLASLLVAWIVLVFCAVVACVLAFPVVIIRAGALPIYWLRVAFSDLRNQKQAGAKPMSTDASQNGFWVAYKKAMERKPPVWKFVDPKTYVNFAGTLLTKVLEVAKQGNFTLLNLRKKIHEASKRITAVYWLERTNAQPKHGGRFRSWSDIDWMPRLWLLGLILLFLLYLFGTVLGFGIAEAKCVKQRIKVGEPGACEYVNQLIKPVLDFRWPVRLICSVKQFSFCPGYGEELPRVIAVPTGNLLSLEFSSCNKETNGGDHGDHLFGQVNFRQDAGNDARDVTPTCLAHLGATGSMQFFADLPDENLGRVIGNQADSLPERPIVIISNGSGSQNPEPPTVPRQSQDIPAVSIIFDERSGVFSGHSCKLDLAALIGPFPTGKGKMSSADSESSTSRLPVKKCTVPGYAEKPLWNVGEAVKAIRKTGNIPPEMLVLVGRADIRPINNDDFGSNMDLTQSRVSWVKEKLDQESLALRVSVLSIPGGPVDSSREPANLIGEIVGAKKRGDDPCSRVVEVYQCPGPESASTADAEDSSDSKTRREQKEGQLESDSDG